MAYSRHFDSTIINARVRRELEGDYEAIKEWGRGRPGHSIASALNAFLPYIAYTLQNTTVEVDGVLYCNGDFGDVPILSAGQKYAIVFADKYDPQSVYYVPTKNKMLRQRRIDWTA